MIYLTTQNIEIKKYNELDSSKNVYYSNKNKTLKFRVT